MIQRQLIEGCHLLLFAKYQKNIKVSEYLKHFYD